MILNNIDSAYVGADQAEKIYLGTEQIYPSGTPPEPPLSAAPLTLEIISGGTIWWERGDGASVTTAAPYTVIYYSKDFGGTWSALTANKEMVEGESYINVNAGDKVQFAGTNEKYDGNVLNLRTSNHFAGTAVFNAYGNILSMHDKDNYLELTGFTTSGSRLSNIFLKANVISAENLIFPDFLADDSTYYGMFYGCTSLTTSPELPATTLANSCYNSMFYGCTSLTQAPALPATTLTDYCYQSMFQDCTSLTTAPALPATTLANSCYGGMFSNCTSLTQAPVLPATALTEYCYSSMFSNCTSLTTAPALPATTLADSCYGGMFSNCTSLTEAPALPATAMTTSCYSSMFSNCTSLTQAPELPATTLAESCYSSMFSNCTSLTQAPVLPATTLAEGCYINMFYGCTSLSSITCYATEKASYSTNDWVDGVASAGTFYRDSSATWWSNGKSGIPQGWTVVPPMPVVHYEQMYLTVEVVSEWGGMLQTQHEVQYSLNGGEWQTSYGGIMLEPGDRVRLKSVAAYGQTGMFRDNSNFDFKVYGNIESMEYGDDFTGATQVKNASAFESYFSYSMGLVDAENLVLPATALTESCYKDMFSDCSNLTQAPVLPATTLEDSCYQEMFSGCASLNTITCLATDMSAGNCLTGWVSGVASTGTFYKNPSVEEWDWPTGTDGIPSGWTVEDYSA